MGDVERALAKVRTASRRWTASVDREKVDRDARDAALRAAADAGATWTQLQDAGDLSRMTVSKAVGPKRART